MTPQQIKENKRKTFRKYCMKCNKWFYCKGDCQVRYKVLETDSACFCPTCGLKAGFDKDNSVTNCESRFGMNAINPSRRDSLRGEKM